MSSKNQNFNNNTKYRPGHGRATSFPPISRLLGRRTPLKPHHVTAGKRLSLDAVRDSESPGGPDRRPHPPASVEAEHRAVMVTVTQVTRDVRQFLAGFRPNSADFDKHQSAARGILQDLGVSELEVDTCRDFKRLLKDFKSDGGRRKPEHDLLESYCDKGIRFEELTSQGKQRLKDTFENHCKKYFLSFGEEVEESSEVAAVKEYEDRIRAHRTSVESHLDALDESLERYGDRSTPFVAGFLADGAKLAPVIEQTCGEMVKVCEVLRRWTLADRQYPGRLWDEIIGCNLHRARDVEDVKKQRRRREEIGQHLGKRQVALDKTRVRLDEIAKERRRSVTQSDQLNERCDRLQDEINSQYASLCEVEDRIKHRKSNSPKYLERLFLKQEALKTEIGRLESRQGAFRRQVDRLGKAADELAASAGALEKDIELQEAGIAKVEARAEKSDQVLDALTRELRAKEARITAAKKVRDIKLAPSTLRKIFYQRLGGQLRDKLTTACRYIANTIGHGWRDLYLDLPFRPPRDHDKRITDLDRVYTACLQRDQPEPEQAWQSLLKWRVFHRQGNVRELVKSLRKLNKEAIARHLEDQAKFPKADETAEHKLPKLSKDDDQKLPKNNGTDEEKLPKYNGTEEQKGTKDDRMDEQKRSKTDETDEQKTREG